jgi:general secretion pathway protein A
MYTEFYGLREKPFSLSPDPQFFYAGPGHRRALSYLEYGLKEKKGIIVISGEIGAGKTTLINVLLDKLGKRDKIARIWNPTFDLIDLYKAILQGFNLPYDSFSKKELLDSLYRFLLRQYSQGGLALLIIDEAQNMSLEALEEVRMFSNLEIPKEKLLQIILVGQPELRKKLVLPELKQLKQRVAVIYHLNALTSEEISLYIQHRLKVAGCPQPDIFTSDALEYIYQLSHGIPRIINLLCDAALLAGYAEGKKKIGPELITQVQQSLGIFSLLPNLDVTIPESRVKDNMDIDLGLSPVIPGLSLPYKERTEPGYEATERETITQSEELMEVSVASDQVPKRTSRLFRTGRTIFLTLAFLFLVLIPWEGLERPWQKIKTGLSLVSVKFKEAYLEEPSLVPADQPTEERDISNLPVEVADLPPLSEPAKHTIPGPSYPETMNPPQDVLPAAPPIETSAKEGGVYHIAKPEESLEQGSIKIINTPSPDTQNELAKGSEEASKVVVAYVNTFALNLRSGKGTQYEIIEWIEEGTPLEILDNSDTWYQVKTPRGQVGYVNSKYLTILSQ